MTTRYKRTLRRHFWTLCDDCVWIWGRHKDGFISGFLFGVLCVVLVTEFVIGLTW